MKRRSFIKGALAGLVALWKYPGSIPDHPIGGLSGVQAVSEKWADQIHKLYPSGPSPLASLLSSSEPFVRPEDRWWEGEFASDPDTWPPGAWIRIGKDGRKEPLISMRIPQVIEMFEDALEAHARL